MTAPSRRLAPLQSVALAALLLLPGAPRADDRLAPDALAPAAPTVTTEPAPPRRLRVDRGQALAWTGTGLLVAGFGALHASDLAPPACRWCEPSGLDRWTRERLRWSDPGAADSVSNLLQVAVPLGASLGLALLSWREAGWSEAADDLVVVAEAVAVTLAVTQVVKLAAARLRPDAGSPTGAGNPAALTAFWSGHAAFTFAAAAAATQVARLRGRPGWPWLGAASFAGAAITGWLRVGADRHWLTDVLAGAAAGTAAGLVIPCLALAPAEGAGALTLIPAPGGLAIRLALP